MPLMDDLLNWLIAHRPELIMVVGGLLLLVLLQRAVRSVRRSRKPVELHPRLQAYAGRSEEQIEADRRAAEMILATSSSNTVAGYEIIRQIEAVFVEGLRTQEEATLALKAAAGRLGANAIINLNQQRTAAGRCIAQGDAVQISPSMPLKTEKR